MRRSRERAAPIEMAIDMHTSAMKEVSITSVLAPKADFRAGCDVDLRKAGRGDGVPCADFSRAAEDRKYVRT